MVNSTMLVAAQVQLPFGAAGELLVSHRQMQLLISKHCW
jgi:hypothetical protein